MQRKRKQVQEKLENDDIFVLAPSIVLQESGDMYPGNPRGRCVFLDSEDKCTIHPVKPFECKAYNHGGNSPGQHKKVALAWLDSQSQVRELLGREPVAAEYEDDLVSSILSNFF